MYSKRFSAALIGSLVCCGSLHAQHAYRFPDTRDVPPAGAPQVFQMSQRFPADKPAAEAYPWAAFDFRDTTEWRKYLRSVLDYAREGNEAVDWDVVKNEGKVGVRQWYHAPWMHWGRNGREYVHGMTHERVAAAGELHTNQTSPVQNWAVSIYNPIGGYAIGQVWKDPENPDPKKGRFDPGSVSIKLLFTAATETQAPYLKGAKEWQAHIYESIVSPTNPRLPRRLQTVRLLQIDVAVRDERADADPSGAPASGWVFGTFVYNGKNPSSDLWDRFEPVGVMWGNDEGVTVSDVRQGTRKLQQSIINAGRDIPYQHLGWAGRLNGPVDNPVSSCISCHATAQVHNLPTTRAKSIVPLGDPDSDEWMKWFKNVSAGKPFTTDEAGWESVDYSLQLSQGIANFREWKLETQNRGGVRNAADAAPEFKIKGAPSTQSRSGRD
jgi:hypothetical protein